MKWAALCLLCAGCGGEPAPPRVSIVAQAPSSLVLGVDEEDDVSLRLAYEDGDSDLGSGVLAVVDCRAADGLLELPFPVVASPEVVAEERSMSGELIALIPDIGEATGGPPAFCDGVAVADDSLVLCLELVDGAGNRSGRACTDPIAVTSAALD